MKEIKQSKDESADSKPVFRSDRPPASLDGDLDAFGHRDYALAISEVLLTAEPPFTMGLFGPWGLGKTSVIEEVERQVAGRAAFAYFDAWRYEGDALRRQFLRDLARSLHPDEADFDPDVCLSDLAESSAQTRQHVAGIDTTVLPEALIRAVLAGLVAFLVFVVVGSSGLRDEHGTLRDVILSLLVSALVFVITPLTRIVRVTEETRTRDRLQDPEHFADRFGLLLASLKKRRLIVAIDNLDRCSPDRVEEILSTIKTYLEPLASASDGDKRFLRRCSRPDKEAVFLIAADDDALRRHLEAKEASSQQSDQPEGRTLVSSYVDEYLRKFFTASVRMRPLLDQDSRAYVAAQFEDLRTSSALDDTTFVRLVEMSAAALGRNPRRIKQFANNLNARLLVIRQREAAQRIKPPISGAVLVIAKLAILEEEWPSAYGQLQRDPRALDGWHLSAMEWTARDDQTPSPKALKDPAFRKFLGISRDIRSSNLSAFLRLKQSQEELDLPRYGEFREAVVQGDTQAVADIVESETARSAEYARHLPDILEEEIERRFYDGARAVVEAAVGVPALAQHDVDVRATLTRALGDGDLRSRLSRASPSAVLGHAHLLAAAADRRLLFDVFMGLNAYSEESPARLEQVIEALARNVAFMPQETQIAFKEALGQARVLERPQILLPVAVSAPELLPAGTGEATLKSLEPQVERPTAGLEVLAQWFTTGKGTSDETAAALRMVAASVVALQNATEDDEWADELLGQLSAVVTDLPDAEANESLVTEFFTTLSLPLSAWLPARHSALLSLVGKAARLSPSVARQHVVRLVNEFFAARPAESVNYARESGTLLDPELAVAFLPELEALVTGSDHKLRFAAAAAIAAIDPVDNEGALERAVDTAADKDLFVTVNRLVADHKAALGAGLPNLVAKALTSLQSSTAPSRAASFLCACADDLAEEELSQFQATLIGMAQSSEPSRVEGVADAVEAASSHDKLLPLARSVVVAAFEHLRGDAPPDTNLVAVVAANLDLLEEQVRSGFVAALSHWLRDPSQRMAVLDAVKKVPPLSSANRAEIVRGLVNAEVMEPDEANRIALLRVAQGMVRSKQGNATKAFNARLDELQSDSEPDQRVYEGVVSEEAPVSDDAGDGT